MDTEEKIGVAVVVGVVLWALFLRRPAPPVVVAPPPPLAPPTIPAPAPVTGIPAAPPGVDPNVAYGLGFMHQIASGVLGSLGKGSPPSVSTPNGDYSEPAIAVSSEQQQFWDSGNTGPAFEP